LSASLRHGEARTRALLRVVAGLIAFGIGCGESTAPPVPVATVVLSPTAVELVPGATDMLQAIPKDAAGNSLTNRVTDWSTSDPSKVAVAAGVVTGVAIGSATVTASVEGHVASMEVKVKDGSVVSPSGASFSAQNSAVTLTIPSGALTQTKNITVAPAIATPPNDRLMPGTAFEFGPNGTSFAQQVTISIKYDPSTLTAGSPESGLQLYEVVGTGWRVVDGSTVNTATKTVTGNVSHFTVYGVLMYPRVETISINRDTTVQVKATIQFAAALKDNEQQPLTRPMTWASSSPGIVSIDSSGLATAIVPGQSTITAISEGKSATAKVTVVPGPASVLAIAAGDGQSVTAGSPVPILPAVKVSDAFGNPVPGFAITFAVASGGGTITGGSATTSASGVATVGSWTIGTTAAPNTLTASGTGLTPASVTFTVAGVAGAPTTAAIFVGNNQTGTAGGPVSTPPAVKITDANGNPVSGFTVVFAPAAGSGSVTDGSALTNASGIAAPTSWLLGTTPGPQSLTATAGTLAGSPLTFAATAVAPIPALVVYNGGDGQSAEVNSPVANVPAVRVVDAANVGVPGFTVTFAVTSGGGTVTGGDALTNINGFASVGSWVLGPNAGPNTLTATAGTLQGSPIVFSATGVAAPPVAMAINAGNQQSVPSNTAVPVRPSVLVTDAAGKGVPNITVAFTIRSGSGTITGVNPVTDASGIATLGSWTLGLGGNSLFATVNGLSGSPLIFVGVGTVQVQLVTFGDSNTDFGFSGTNPSPLAASYVSNGAPVRLAPDVPNSPFQLAGKIEARWRAVKTQTIRVVNHGISGTTTDTGRNTLYSPNARETVGGVTRFQGEALGAAYPWNGGETTNDTSFPNGPILRVQAFSPRTSDFLYISMGTNDVASDVNIPTSTSLANLEWMIDQWVSIGMPSSHLMLTTLPPRTTSATDQTRIRNLNDGIRALAQRKGVKLIDLVTYCSNDNGATWADVSYHLNNDLLHYSEQIRDRIAADAVSYMSSLTP
jgi:lysophospholipase L1-like esterase